MENNRGVILCEYRQADFNQRLDMFMHHRELRQDFTKIDKQLIPGYEADTVPASSILAIIRSIFRLADLTPRP